MPLPSIDDITKVLKGALTIEAQEKIMELRVAALGFQSENLEFKARISELEAELTTKKTLKHSGELYWQQDDPVPFCPICFETTDKAVHLADPDHYNGKLQWRCFVCKNRFAAGQRPVSG